MQAVGIAIAGGSCSGKTTLACSLSRQLHATLVRLDDYYRPLDHLTYEQRCEVNFDHPDSIDSARLIRDVAALLRGEAVDAPRYDFTKHTLFPDTVRVTPTPVVIVEGLFTLCYPELAEMCALRVFVDAPEEICLERRLTRDVCERGRTPEEVTGRFESHVAPMYRAHVLPSAAHANIRVCGTSPIELGRDNVLAQVT